MLQRNLLPSASSYGKLMFSQASVILSTGGVCQTLPGQTTPQADAPWADIPLGRHPTGQTPPRVDTPRQTLPSLGRHPLLADTPWADTHPGRRLLQRTYASYWYPFLLSYISRTSNALAENIDHIYVFFNPTSST